MVSALLGIFGELLRRTRSRKKAASFFPRMRRRKPVDQSIEELDDLDLDGDLDDIEGEVDDVMGGTEVVDESESLA